MSNRANLYFPYNGELYIKTKEGTKTLSINGSNTKCELLINWIENLLSDKFKTDKNLINLLVNTLTVKEESTITPIPQSFFKDWDAAEKFKNNSVNIIILTNE